MGLPMGLARVSWRAGGVDCRPLHTNDYLLFQTTQLNIATLCIIC